MESATGTLQAIWWLMVTQLKVGCGRILVAGVCSVFIWSKFSWDARTYRTGFISHALHATMLAAAKKSAHQIAAIYQTFMLQILSYGSEAWTLLQATCADCSHFTWEWDRCQRQMLGVKCCDHVKNVDIAAATLPSIDKVVCKRRNALFGHIVRLCAYPHTSSSSSRHSH